MVGNAPKTMIVWLKTQGIWCRNKGNFSPSTNRLWKGNVESFSVKACLEYFEEVEPCLPQTWCTPTSKFSLRSFQSAHNTSFQMENKMALTKQVMLFSRLLYIYTIAIQLKWSDSKNWLLILFSFKDWINLLAHHQVIWQLQIQKPPQN